MSRLSRLLFYSCAAAALGLCPAPARAVSTEYFGGSSTAGVPETLPLLDQVLHLPKAEIPQSEVLKSVTITYNATLTGAADGSYGGSNPQQIRVFSNGNVTFDTSGVASMPSELSVPLTVDKTFTLSGNPGTGAFSESFPATFAQTWSLTSATKPDGTPNPGGVDLSAFEGPGTFDVKVKATGIPAMFLGSMTSAEIVFGGAQGLGSVNQQVFGSVTVAYSFAARETAVPEPAGIALMASGVGMVMLARGRLARGRRARPGGHPAR